MLRGIAWNHTRAMAPLHGLAQLWRDRTGEEAIRWDTRSLKSFAEDPLDRFAADYDLIVFDYPFAGEALAAGWLHDLNTLLPAELLDQRRSGCVGRTYESYMHGGRLAALPIDAASHVCAWRPDLLDDVPSGWSATVDLARQARTVAMPLTPTAVWGALITLCANAAAPPMRAPGSAFDRAAALEAWERLAALAELVPRWCFESSPVATLNRMSATDEISYCPLTYGYTTYAMPGYAERPIRFGDIRIGGAAGPGGAVLGGAGIGVSALSRDPARAAAMAAWLTSDQVQATVYHQLGGQPAASAAWDAPAADALAGGFYTATRASMDRCYHRPCMPGFHAFQTRSANALQRALRDRASPVTALDAIDAEWAGLAGC